jgi:VWFA-related protein
MKQRSCTLATPIEWAIPVASRAARACANLLFPFLLMLGLLVAQKPSSDETLTKTINLIQVPVVVRDSKGFSVTDLKPEDFILYDNGRRQSIAKFNYLAPGNTPLAHGVAAESNRAPTDEPTAAESRRDAAVAATRWDSHLLIVIPQLQFTSRYYALRAISKALQHHLLDNQSVAIVDNSSLVLPFTRDQDSVARAVKQLQDTKLSPCWTGPWIPAAYERLLQMRSMQGRKFVVMFSDGVRDPQCVGRLFVGSSPSVLLSPALDASVAIYPMDPRGNVPVIPGGDASTDLSGSGEGWRGLTNAINNQLSAETLMLGRHRAELLTVAADTGGRSPEGNDLERAFRDIQTDSSYYDIGYYLPNLQADGAYHKLRIELPRAGLRVFAKKGYFAPIPFAGLSRGQKREWLYKALLAGQLLGQIEIGSRNSAFFNPPSAHVTIEAAVRAQWWTPLKNANNRRWTMLVGVVQDEKGTVVDTVETTNFWHPEEQPQDEGGYTAQCAIYNLQLQLKPGRYELKLAVADLDAAIAGSYRTVLQVPDTPPSLPRASSLVLGEKWLPIQDNAHAEETGGDPAAITSVVGRVVWPDPLQIDGRHLQPSAQRSFRADTQLSVFLRFYPSPDDRFPEGWAISALLLDSNGKVAAKSPVTVPSSNDGAPGFPIAFTFDLSKVTPHEGRYTAEVEFAHSGQKQPLRFSGQFVIGREEQ